jgi:hypothetical protein
LKGSCPMMFELLLDVMERTCEMPGCHGKNCIVGAKWHNINVKRFITARSHRIESVRTPIRIIPYPTGRHFGVALSQALRARLRSYRPFGTFRNRLS